MPRKQVIAEIIDSDEEPDTRINIETSPTPSASEEETDQQTTMEEVEGGASAKTKNVKADLVDTKKAGRTKKPMTPERQAQLNAMREAKKRKYDDYKESQAILFLRDRGFSVDTKAISKQLKAKADAKTEAKTIHLTDTKPPPPKAPAPKPVLAPEVKQVQSVPANQKPSLTTVYRQKPYNPYAD